MDNEISLALESTPPTYESVNSTEAHDYSIGAVTRGEKAGQLALPYNEVGDKLLFYLFFQSATDETLVSTSQLVGSVVIT